MFVKKMYKDMAVSYCIALSCLLVTPFVENIDFIMLLTMFIGILYFIFRYIYVGFKWKEGAVKQYRLKVKSKWITYLITYLIVNMVVLNTVRLVFV